MAHQAKKGRRPWEGPTKCPKFVDRPGVISSPLYYYSTQENLMKRLPQIEKMMWDTGKKIMEMRLFRNRRGEFNLKSEDALPLLKAVVDCAMNVVRFAFERCTHRKTNTKTLPILCAAALLYSLGNYADYDYVDLRDSIRLMVDLNDRQFSKKDLKKAVWELVVHFPSCSFLEL